jgi:hypothetical protein
MTLAEIQQKLGLTLLTPELPPDDSQTITGGYASDLLSDVLAHAPQGGVLVTAQVHLNVIAVAAHVELAAVDFSLRRAPEASVLERAAEEGIVLFGADATTFDIAGQLYALGLRGDHE